MKFKEGDIVVSPKTGNKVKVTKYIKNSDVFEGNIVESPRGTYPKGEFSNCWVVSCFKLCEENSFWRV